MELYRIIKEIEYNGNEYYYIQERYLLFFYRFLKNSCGDRIKFASECSANYHIDTLEGEDIKETKIIKRK
jgi:hypothetical protein